jgi:hypothetical protein
MLLEGSLENIYQSCMFWLTECVTKLSYFLVLRDLINLENMVSVGFWGRAETSLYCFHIEMKSRLILEVHATIYFVIVFAKNVRIKSQTLQ